MPSHSTAEALEVFVFEFVPEDRREEARAELCALIREVENHV